MHDLEKKVNRRLNSKHVHDLRYKKLCLHSRVELPSEFKILKFNMFDGDGDPIAHLKPLTGGLLFLSPGVIARRSLVRAAGAGVVAVVFAEEDSIWEEGPAVVGAAELAWPLST
ncbi:hypothetical protein KY290_033489 [Solanum tuberosum]|uniref:PA domain-containing protein n=1 Tax=Solanum tuberosum TaxID=4113 RepID=A0ABQ7U264_SOLTU|nr:hypothetical protein KY289_032849 [Solanum tuberosum]KAH0647493.1 hypothetical protein KY285_032741 [Solanum tuberosum]KAH0740446.1 hypothetical protein KY290_033489 [Solanum tuberosum]